MEDAIEQVPDAPKPKKVKKVAVEEKRKDDDDAVPEKKRKAEEPAADASIMRMVSSLEGMVLRLVSKCDDREELAEILIGTSDSAAVVSAVLLKLSTCAPTTRTDSESRVFSALVRVLTSEKTTRELATLTVASVPSCSYGAEADELATALLRTALRFPDLAKSCVVTINNVRGVSDFADVSWPRE